VAGIFWGVAISGINNSLWGGFGWGRGNVNINVNHYNNMNVNRRITDNNNTFVHNADRRRDVPYRDAKSREQYGKKQLDGEKNREAFRGKDGRERLQGADRDKAANAVRDTDRSRAGGGVGAADRNRADSVSRNIDRGAGGASNRATDRAAPSSALSGVRDSGASRASADRGRASAQSMGQRTGGGGGAARAGGGGGGGGGGGRHR